MKLKFLILIAAFCLIVFAVYSQMKKDDFASAKDFPRDALIYVQIADLPAFIKLWNESKLKEKYLESDNFKDFQNQHLGRKLASRWKEFNTATGFQIDLETLAGLAENRAAIALYDVGKLEFVFIAPISGEIFAATKFLQNKEKFAGQILVDGTIIYRVTVEADRGRQSQELVFTHSNGRLIVATNEKLIARTLDNINGKSTKTRLFDEPAFQNLSSKTTPHTATVWINQNALNDDYYFKRYWLMSDVKDLKNIRAGIFDLEIQTEKIIENRKFLLKEPRRTLPINLKQAETSLSVLPENIPFFNLRNAEKDSINEAIEKTIFYRNEEKRKTDNTKNYNEFEFADYENYRHLSEFFDEKIDEIEEIETTVRREERSDFIKIMQTANPQSILTFAEPKVLSAPLFIEFDSASVFYFSSPNNFAKEDFEAEISRSLLKKTMISAPNVNLKWETKSENNLTWRELKLPMLDWKICYILQGNNFILTNNAEFLHKIAESKNKQVNFNLRDSLTCLSVVDLTQKETAFTEIFNRIQTRSVNSYFFSYNIGSLINALSDVKKIEIKQRNSENISDEEIIFHIK